MIDITVDKIVGLASNASADKNGRDLVSKGKFSELKTDADEVLIWGQCAGSGKNPYYCSADFVDKNAPVFRCSCPSRQFPCKHCIGLLYAFVQGKTFDKSDIPEDIASKRAKIEKKQEKKQQEKESIKEQADKPKKVNKAALVKKIDAQLKGIETATKILTNIVQNGLATIDAKETKNLQAQVKELGNYYINGIQGSFNDLLMELGDVENEEYTNVIDQINYLTALLKKSTQYLNQRKENPENGMEIDSAIEEQIGYVWKLVELIQHGLWEENAELVQLSFNNYDNPARKMVVEEGSWINLKTGKMYKTKNYRPYKALKYIKEDNSISEVIKLKELYIYPGDLNPRVRWEQEQTETRALSESDIAKIQSFASVNYSDLLKSVKNVIKNPLMDKNPLVLLSISKAYLNGEHIVVEDASGNKLTLCDLPGRALSPETSLKQILSANTNNLVLLGMVNNNVQSGLISVEPMSILTKTKIIKLLY